MTQGSEPNRAFTAPPIDRAGVLRAVVRILEEAPAIERGCTWGAWVGRLPGSEADGFKIMAGANEANRTPIGPALDCPIREGNWVHAQRGIGNRWGDVIVPGFDFCAVENTLAKDGPNVGCRARVPIHAQELVWSK